MGGAAEAVGRHAALSIAAGARSELPRPLPVLKIMRNKKKKKKKKKTFSSVLPRLN
eukprot:NODE_6077_length_531_cov_198.682773.p6 GENE.NODE_6077_length_531_cov_198.682773~~NODE_6077_length_531_cov_198.682773.p6  ORF type:complete len:56 (+),score=32.90 NODE_6077_length_531_cov_198.682773:336-503(+)